MSVKLISFADFSKLRYGDFFPSDMPRYYEDSGFECLLGLAGSEGNPGTYFAWPQHQVGLTGEISLDFRKEYNTCPSEIAKPILQAVRLPITPGMKAEELVALLGKPRESSEYDNGVTRLVFRCSGDEGAKYELWCFARKDAGLTSLKIVRLDLKDKN